LQRIAAALAVVVLGVAAWAGVAFADCGGSSASLVWLSPRGAVVPSTHTYVQCRESGANTATLGLSASNLGPGDTCDFSASLFNNGQVGLSVNPTAVESTPPGAPPFATCFLMSVSAGPPAGWIPEGGTFPYTFAVGLLGSAPAQCEKVVGTAQITFHGSEPCSNQGGSPPPRSLLLGPDANLRGANLAGLDLAGKDMAGDSLEGADLACADLVGTDLAGADLQGANLTFADLASACAQNAVFAGAQLIATTLSGANLADANLANANLEASVLTGLPHQSTNFDGANLEGINIADVVATGRITAVGATTTGTLNVASCVAASSTAIYCDEL